jgi:hypothetical protein
MKTGGNCRSQQHREDCDMKKLFVLGALAAMPHGHGLASGKKIAFSNNYAGNSWRQACRQLRHRHQRRLPIGWSGPWTSSPMLTRKCRHSAQVQNLILGL